MATQSKPIARPRTKAPVKVPATKATTRRSNLTKSVEQTPMPARPVPAGKLGVLFGLLNRPGGAQISDLMSATGWQAHSVRGAIAGALKRGCGLTVISEKTEAGRVYRIDPDALTGASAGALS